MKLTAGSIFVAIDLGSHKSAFNWLWLGRSSRLSIAELSISVRSLIKNSYGSICVHYNSFRVYVFELNSYYPRAVHLCWLPYCIKRFIAEMRSRVVLKNLVLCNLLIVSHTSHSHVIHVSYTYCLLILINNKTNNGITPNKKKND